MMNYYISVTGLLTKNWLSTPKFLYLSARAHDAALKSEGNIHSSTFRNSGIYMTITVWESKELMREFFRGAAHATAMKSMKDVSRYAKVHGYFADTVPVSVEDAIAEWRTNGRRVYGEPMEAYGDCVEEPYPEPF
ncbi:hypothetical protein ACHAXT_002981 [Thalassiosira profunda]